MESEGEKELAKSPRGGKRIHVVTSLKLFYWQW